MLDLLIEYKTFVFRGLFESFLLLLFFLMLFKYTNIIEIFNKNYKKKIIYIFFSILIFVQIVDRFQQFYPQYIDFYPFARFSMYQAAPNELTTEGYRFCYYKNSNSECNEVNVTKIFSTIGVPSISSRMKYLTDNMPQTNNEIDLWLIAIDKSVHLENVESFTFEKVVYKNKKFSFKVLRILNVQN